MTTVNYTVPGIEEATAANVNEILDHRLVSLIDLSLTLKHVHWNVVGPTFIAVHQMLDPQVDAVRAMVDETAERIATLGGSPVGTPGALVARRGWDDYRLGRALVGDHLAALDRVYTGVVRDHRAAHETLDKLDPVSADMVIAQLHQLEQFQWFVRAHLENASGELGTTGGASASAT